MAPFTELKPVKKFTNRKTAVSLNCASETLSATMRSRRGSRLPHLSHAAFTDRRNNFIRAEFVACRKRHVLIQLSVADQNANYS